MSKKPKSLIEDLARGLWWIFAVCVLFAIGVVYMEWRFDNQLRYRIPDLAAVVDHGVEPVSLVSGQKKAAYVPAYSHVYYQDGRAALLAVALSVRNTDRNHEIALTSVRYYDSHGIVVRSHLRCCHTQREKRVSSSQSFGSSSNPELCLIIASTVSKSRFDKCYSSIWTLAMDCAISARPRTTLLFRPMRATAIATCSYL